MHHEGRGAAVGRNQKVCQENKLSQVCSTKTTKNGLTSPLDSSIQQGIREAQPLTYTKLAGVKTGRLINFNVTKQRDRTKRFML